MHVKKIEQLEQAQKKNTYPRKREKEKHSESENESVSREKRM